MKVLFIGGTGLISTASTQLAVEKGIDLYLLNRGRHEASLPEGVKSLRADINQDPGAAAKAIGEHTFDSVVDWIAFTPEQVRRDIDLFRGRTRQYIFISSASVYQKPARHYLVHEDTPLDNPFWDYSRNKIAAEDVLLQALRQEAFPGVIVRPSLTYGDSQIPLIINSWREPYTAIKRMMEGKPVIVPGDGTSLWTMTHNSDFAKGLVGLLGQERATGHAFHITSDEVLTWNQLYEITARAAGVEPKLLHIPSDFIATCLPQEKGSLYGDKGGSLVFDNRKIKSFVPNFAATTNFAEGIGQTLAWFEADAARRKIDAKLDADWDKIIAAYEGGLELARKAFQKT